MSFFRYPVLKGSVMAPEISLILFKFWATLGTKHQWKKRRTIANFKAHKWPNKISTHTFWGWRKKSSSQVSFVSVDIWRKRFCVCLSSAVSSPIIERFCSVRNVLRKLAWFEKLKVDLMFWYLQVHSYTLAPGFPELFPMRQCDRKAGILKSARKVLPCQKFYMSFASVL